MMPGNNDDIIISNEADTKQTKSLLDDEVEGHLNEFEESQNQVPIQQPDARGENLSRLSQSSRQLGSAIASWGSGVDQKLKVSEKARAVDEKASITSTTKQGWSNLTSWYNQSGLGDKTKQATTAISSSVRNLDEKYHISEKAGGASRGVKEWDEKNKVSEKVTGGLANGMEFVSSKVCTTQDSTADATSNVSNDVGSVNSKNNDENSKEAGNDDFPSSFQK